MKISVACVFILLSYCLTSQPLKIQSAKDSLPVAFASVMVKNENSHLSRAADENGIVNLKEKWNDTLNYSLSVYSFGFQKYHRVLKGSELKDLNAIYLQRSDIKLEEVVVTSQYEPISADQSVQRIKVIDSEKIRQMAAVNLRDVLTNQLNVRLQQDNVLGSSISVQGVGGQNVKILLDGVPMIGRQNGNIDLTQINLNNVERIEFVEGRCRCNMVPTLWQEL